MTKHTNLARLDSVWIKHPRYYITTCVSGRAKVLDSADAHQILRDEWAGMMERHGWMIGPYVLMPDHVHFFVAAGHQDARPLSQAIAKWKEWTAKRLNIGQRIILPFWQRSFFDHLVRSDESWEDKCRYVMNNPVRAGLIDQADKWTFQGWIDFK